MTGVAHRPRRLVTAAVLCATCTHCQFDRSDRWDDVRASLPEDCVLGALRCTSRLERCDSIGGRSRWNLADDCAAKGLICAPSMLQCTKCLPATRDCEGQSVVACRDDGSAFDPVDLCDSSLGEACRSGACSHLCSEASTVKSNVGCEYWAADLDNANISPNSNAAAQQFAVVVSNPQHDLHAEVTVEVDDARVGDVSQPRVVGEATIPPSGLRVFLLGPREVDGSAPGTFNTGPGTAHTRQAFRLRSQVPVVAYQFNPLDNVNVFSNDASLLKPVEALSGSGMLEVAYVVMGWPQTIAVTDDPDTNFNPAAPIHLRAFVAILGTRSDTRVRFTTATHVVAGQGIAPLAPGDTLEVVLQPFEVLNLETGDFLSDFTGSLVESDRPVVVFSGTEASDAPTFERLADRACCADHLEEQLDPVRTAGTAFVAAHGPNRARAVAAAGAQVAEVPEPEFFRVLALSADGPTTVTTSLPAPDDRFVLPGRGAFLDLASYGDFALAADRPVTFAAIQASQDAGGVRRPLPGGDPSLVIVPPTQQFRKDYVFLTPDKYAFDFLVVTAPPQAVVTVDGRDMAELGCDVAWANGGDVPKVAGVPEARVHRCQLSFPFIDPSLPPEQGVFPGTQNDGVHRVVSDMNVGLIVYGFDERVSYGYAAGTQLEAIAVP